MTQTDDKLPVPASMGPSPMRTVTYVRHEYHGEPEIHTAELAVFVYDIPYVGACGIFPPYPLINGLFESGGAEGGMGPGATWKPFSITLAEYDVLVKTLEALDPKGLKDKVRFGQVKFEFDEELAAETKQETWVEKVCERHRETWHKKIAHTL